MLALEEERFHNLPVAAYTQGFVRSYCQYLGIDVSEAMRLYKNLVYQDKDKHGHEKIPSRSIMTFSIRPYSKIILILFFISSLVYLSITLFIQKANISPLFKPVQKVPSFTQKEKDDSSSFALSIRAIDLTWLSIIIDGKPPGEETTLKPEETLEVEAQKSFDLKIGNGGGIEIYLNGRSWGIPGDPGEVLNLTLTRKDIPVPKD